MHYALERIAFQPFPQMEKKKTTVNKYSAKASLWISKTSPAYSPHHPWYGIRIFKSRFSIHKEESHICTKLKSIQVLFVEQSKNKLRLPAGPRLFQRQRPHSGRNQHLLPRTGHAYTRQVWGTTKPQDTQSVSTRSAKWASKSGK